MYQFLLRRIYLLNSSRHPLQWVDNRTFEKGSPMLRSAFSCRAATWCALLAGLWLDGLPGLSAPAVAKAQPAGAVEQAREGGGAELEGILAQLVLAAERVTMGGRMGSAGDSLPDVVNLCRAARFLPGVSTADRYTLLQKWVMPAEPGAPLRNAMYIAPVDFPPELFFSPLEGPVAVDGAAKTTQRGTGADGVITFMDVLVVAAAETDHLEELTNAAEGAVAHCEIARALYGFAAFELADARPDAGRRAYRRAVATGNPSPGSYSHQALADLLDGPRLD